MKPWITNSFLASMVFFQHPSTHLCEDADWLNLVRYPLLWESWTQWPCPVQKMAIIPILQCLHFSHLLHPINFFSWCECLNHVSLGSNFKRESYSWQTNFKNPSALHLVPDSYYKYDLKAAHNNHARTWRLCYPQISCISLIVHQFLKSALHKVSGHRQTIGKSFPDCNMNRQTSVSNTPVWLRSR